MVADIEFLSSYSEMCLGTVAFINLTLAVFSISEIPISTAVVLHMVVCLGSMVGVFLIFVGSFMRFE